MDSSVFSRLFGLVILYVVVLGNVVDYVGFVRSQANSNDFITWDDLRLDAMMKGGLDLSEVRNRSRIIVVDKNGDGGDSVTVQGAVDMVPPNNSQRVKIYIRPGIYREKVFVPVSKPYISFIGNEDEPSHTLITWNNKASDRNKDGSELGTFRSASVTIESSFFCASGLTFENSVVATPGGNGTQAVALRIAGDKAFLHRVRVLGTQDTLLDESGSHYFYHSYIRGSIDFIFGGATSLYKDCVLHSVATRYGAIAAHHRESPTDETGFSFVNCTINGTGNIYLGRAWGRYSRILFSYCDITGIITPGGWSDWSDESRQKTAEFGEYQCRGQGADTSRRVPWLRSFSPEEAAPFLGLGFISGEQWLRL